GGPPGGTAGAADRAGGEPVAGHRAGRRGRGSAGRAGKAGVSTAVGADALEAAEDDGRVRVSLGDVVLAEYGVAPPTPAPDSPKPYLHPLRTTAGETVTAVRPHDHTWHNGVQFTMANLSGENFWGGRTYLRGRGYTPLDNNGTVGHVRWEG